MNLLGQTIDAKSFQYPNRRFKIIKHLGKGGEGEVYLSETQNWIENQVPQIALKFQTKQEDITFIQSLKSYQQEKESQAFAFASGMIKIFDIFEWNQYQVIAMEAGSTDLYQYIKSIYTEQEAFQILQQLSHSVKFLHSNNLIHRDLKPENYIRVGDKFKLIDFGLVKQSQRRATQVGTPLFQAPEIVNNQEYSTPVDIWSLGCVFFEVLTKQPLFLADNTQELLKIIKSHLNNPTLLYTRVEQLIKNSILLKLIKDMIHPEPLRRPAIDEIQRQLNVLVFSNFNRKNIHGIVNNSAFPPQPHFNPINIQQQPFDYLSSQKEIILQIKDFKEIQQSQNNDLAIQLNQMFEKFEKKIESKFQLYNLKEQQDEKYQQLQNNLQQLSLLPQMQNNQENLQNNINQITQDCLEIKQFCSCVPKIFEIQNITQSDLKQIITVCLEINDRNFIAEIQQQYDKLQTQIQENYEELKQNRNIILDNQIKQNDSLNLINQMNQFCTEINNHIQEQPILKSEVQKIMLTFEEIKDKHFIQKIQQLEENIKNQFNHNYDRFQNLISQGNQKCEKMQNDYLTKTQNVQAQFQNDQEQIFSVCKEIKNRSIISEIQENLLKNVQLNLEEFKHNSNIIPTIKQKYDDLDALINQVSQECLEIKNASLKISNILEQQAKSYSSINQVVQENLEKIDKGNQQNPNKLEANMSEKYSKPSDTILQKVNASSGSCANVGLNKKNNQIPE